MGAVMTIGSGQPYNVHTGNGVTTTFAYGFTLLDEGDLDCTVDDVSTSPSSVTGVGAAAGGTVIFSPAPANGTEIILRRVMALTRLVDYQTNGDLLAETLDGDIDRVYLLLQGIDSDNDRSIKAPFPETLDELPDADARALRTVGFDADGALTVNVPSDESAAALALQLASSALYTQGAGMSGFDPTLNYVASTIGASLQDNLVNVMWFLTEAERAQVKANGVTTDLTSKITAAKSFAGDRPLYLPAGTWSFTSIDCKGWYGGLIGDGIDNTILKVRSSVTRAIDINETADVIYSPLVLKGFTLDSNSLATTGIDLRYRHHTVFESLLVTGHVTTGIKEKDAWLNRRVGVRVQGGVTGWHLVGSNHGSVWQGGGATACTGTHLKIESLGTAADGNSALTFNAFEIEFGGTAGVGAAITATDVSFNGCYLGENIEGAVLNITGGKVSVNGGVFFVGHTVTTYGVVGSGGSVNFKGTAMSWQTNNSLFYFASSTGVKVNFELGAGSVATGGSPVVVGDFLGYGPPGIVFAKRLGKAWTKTENAATATTALVGSNGRSVTCTAAPGPSPIVGLECALSGNAEWRDGEPLYLVVVYSSNVALDIRFSATSFGGAPTSVISLPATTSNAIWTHIKIDVNASAAAYALIEILINPAAVNNTFTLYECFLADSRMLNKGAAQFGNLYKC